MHDGYKVYSLTSHIKTKRQISDIHIEYYSNELVPIERFEFYHTSMAWLSVTRLLCVYS